ncbi:MAG: hypothetical protein K6B71_00865 [Alphaproteobacteria bacterium]|nr:hypothetical protein [Alphaproteobacteria bacterium]
MKKILFVMMSVLVGTNAFAASSLVSGANQNKNTVLKIGRAATLKTTSATKVSTGKSFVSNVVNATTGRMARLPFFGTSKPLNTNSGSYSGAGIAGRYINLDKKDGGRIVWWFEDDNGNKSAEQVLFTFNDLPKNLAQDIAAEFRCYDGVYEYRVRGNDDWIRVENSTCAVGQVYDGADGANGLTPHFDCINHILAYTYDNPESTDAKWVMLNDSKCDADKGADFEGGEPTLKCINVSSKVGIISSDLYFTYKSKPSECNKDGCPEPDWTRVVGAKCYVLGKTVNRDMDISCIGGLLYIDGSNQYIRCDTASGNDYYSGNAETGNMLRCDNGFLTNSEGTHKTEIPCEGDEAYGCGEDGWVYQYKNGKVVNKMDMSCAAVELFSCWGPENDRTVFVGGVNTRVPCDNVGFACDQNTGLLSVNGNTQLIPFEEDFVIPCYEALQFVNCDEETGKVAIYDCEKEYNGKLPYTEGKQSEQCEKDADGNIVYCTTSAKQVAGTLCVDTDGDGVCDAKAGMTKSGIDAGQAKAATNLKGLDNEELKANIEKSCEKYLTNITCRRWWTYCSENRGKYDCLSSQTGEIYNGLKGLGYNDCITRCKPQM